MLPPSHIFRPGAPATSGAIFRPWGPPPGVVGVVGPSRLPEQPTEVDSGSEEDTSIEAVAI